MKRTDPRGLDFASAAKKRSDHVQHAEVDERWVEHRHLALGYIQNTQTSIKNSFQNIIFLKNKKSENGFLCCDIDRIRIGSKTMIKNKERQKEESNFCKLASI